jgi:hypothetical protein
MKNTQYPVDQLEKQFESQIVLDMIEMKTILGTDVDMTIYRNLKRLCYISSYSHAGKYYSLKRLARFDLHGLWHYKDIHFSSSGTLKNTVLSLLEQSEEGYLAKELQEILQVTSHNVLLALCRTNQIIREQTGKNFVYFHPDKIAVQLKHRKQRGFQPVSTYAECLGLFLKGMNYPGAEPRSIRIISVVLHIFSHRSFLDLQHIS